MKSFEGYLKKKLGNSYVLLAGGDTKALSSFVGSITWDATNRKLSYTPIGATTATALFTLGSHAFDSTTYSTTDENVKQTPKTDNVNRPLMMINGGTTSVE